MKFLPRLAGPRQRARPSAATARYRPKLSAQPHWPSPPLPSQPAASPGEPGRPPGTVESLRSWSRANWRPGAKLLPVLGGEHPEATETTLTGARDPRREKPSRLEEKMGLQRRGEMAAQGVSPPCANPRRTPAARGHAP
uniref:uncharacterized protein LOC117716435 n=1 Tax=Arvicanthis niloticus TaxID=61156 RepID=UPI001485F65B|nr:uncharacterized protein LOC117716435 [Arvicanthis niloticus]